MAHYRLYMLDEHDHIRHARDLDCPDDQAAVNTIREHRLPPPMELWCGKRVVHRFRLEGPASWAGDQSRDRLVDATGIEPVTPSV